MNTNILPYSLFGSARDQEVDHTFVKFIIYPLTMIAVKQLCSQIFIEFKPGLSTLLNWLESFTSLHISFTCKITRTEPKSLPEMFLWLQKIFADCFIFFNSC